MAKTILGTFDAVYHHIDAPTFEDKERSKECGHRMLEISPLGDEGFTNPAICELVYTMEWTATRKLDGTNIRIRWDGEQAVVAGKTNSANLAALGKVFEDYMMEHFLEERFEEKFGRDKEVIIFGEWMGPKVQGNELGLEEPELVVFDVQINGIWLDKNGVRDIAEHFDCHTPMDYMKFNEPISGPLDELIYDVSDGTYSEWEGLVAEPAGQFRDKAGRRIICKIKNRDYNPNWKEKK